MTVFLCIMAFMSMTTSITIEGSKSEKVIRDVNIALALKVLLTLGLAALALKSYLS